MARMFYSFFMRSWFVPSVSAIVIVAATSQVGCDSIESEPDYQKKLATFDRIALRADASRKATMAKERADFEKEHTALSTSPQRKPLVRKLASRIWVSISAHDKAITDALVAAALPELARKGWIGKFQSTLNAETVEISADGSMKQSIRERKGSKYTYSNRFGRVIRVTETQLTFKDSGVEAPDQVFNVDGPPKSQPGGIGFRNDGDLYLRK